MLFMSLLSLGGVGKEAVEYSKKLKAPKGITIHDVYVTFGRYDSVVIFETPTPKKAMGFVPGVGIETGYLIETLSGVAGEEV